MFGFGRRDFQDRRLQPLGHPSALGATITYNAAERPMKPHGSGFGSGLVLKFVRFHASACPDTLPLCCIARPSTAIGGLQVPLSRRMCGHWLVSEGLHAVVQPIRDVNLPEPVEGDIRRMGKLAQGGSRRAPLAKEHTTAGEFLNAIVSPV